MDRDTDRSLPRSTWVREVPSHYARVQIHQSVTSADYVVSGLRVRSEIPLAAERVSLASVDAVVLDGPLATEIPWERPSADVVAELRDPQGWPRYSFCRMPDGSTMARFYAVADFTLRDDLRAITCHRDPAVSQEVAGLLVAGTIAAYLRSLAGDCVLHASAVEISRGRAVAFVGPSGHGKTTCAALLCVEGCGLVSDDVLVIDSSSAPTRCARGATELRLRTQQADLVARFAETPEVSLTPDERLSVRPTRSVAQDLELAAIVVPRPSRDARRPELTRLHASEAVLLLLSVPRIEGWRSPAHLTQLFGFATDIASTVPVFSCDVPWGAPVPAGVGGQLLQEMTRVLAPAVV